MPNDALNYSFIAEELDRSLVGSRIEKIFMPTANEIILRCHSAKNSYMLLISAASSSPGIYLTDIRRENPITAPSFLMHLRKHVGNGVITRVSAEPYERVVVVDVLSKTEFVAATKKIVVEITGTYSNIILLDENGVITEAIKHIHPDMSPTRPILPGLAYSHIPSQNKLLPCDEKLVDLMTEQGGDRPDKYILSVMSGMAPATITECVVRALGSVRKIASRAEAQAVFSAINGIKDVKDPCLMKRDGKYVDFFTSPFVSIKGEVERHATLSECMDIYYSDKGDKGELGAELKKLNGIIKNAEKRTRKKLEEFNNKKSECLDCERDRIVGELITANIYRIKKGEAAAKLYNYYDDETIEVSLDVNKTPAENAQAYFKRYSKKKNTLAALEDQIVEAEKALAKYENAMNSFELCSTRADLEDVKAELAGLKLINPAQTKRRKNETSEYLSVNCLGFRIDIGKNNIQNERLYKSAAQKDVWLHVLGAHGSHVIVRYADKEVPEEVILAAAQLAAYYSKSRMADKVPVDYTLAKFVKPIGGAGPGRVNYTNQKTIYVSPKSVIDIKQ